MTRRVVEVAPARLEGWLARFADNNPDGPQRVDGVERFDHDPLAVVLVRRGGYAVGVASGELLTAHKVGSRYVQSRTAAGGWSQQRFARRRDNQARQAYEAAADHAARILAGLRGPVVVGGDRTAVDEVLADRRLGNLVAIGPWLAVPDPRRGVLEQAIADAGAVRVDVHNAEK